MKSRIFTTTALFCSVLFARADVEVTMSQLRNIGFLPQDKADLKPEDKLDLKQRNPFAERAKTVVASKPKDGTETEETKLRGYFDKLPVSGLSKIGDKITVTMGRHVLEAGDVLPQVIAGQTQILRVMKVEPALLEIGWVEEAGYDISTPRKITKKIDLTPKVKVLLASEDSFGDNAEIYLTDDKGKVILPQRNMLPNPSDIVDNLPPGSDTNPDSALTSAEQDDLNAGSAAPNSPPPAPSAPAPAPAPPAAVTDAVPAGDTPPAASNEDSVQPDPDMAPPPASEGAGKPAGPPAK